MLHLIGFDDLDSNIGRDCLAVYERGDLCVFVDQGHLVATDFPLEGPGYLLGDEGPPAARAADLETIDYDRLVALIAEQGPVTGWYDTENS
ncbi:MAG TPA: hypothetical protein VFX91_05390 [Alcanivorax sp.]|nr:hypothetical protein [Alcanivorax sp.]